MVVAACNVNFANAYMIAYHVHVYTRASLILSLNPNPHSSNLISPYCHVAEYTGHQFFSTYCEFAAATCSNKNSQTEAHTVNKYAVYS